MQNDECGGLEEIKDGRYPTQEEMFYTEYGEELYKKTLPFLNDVLRQIMTMSITLSGGTLMFLTEPKCDKTMKLVAAVMFFIAIAFSFVGVMPYRDSINLDVPNEIKDNVKRAIAWKFGLLVGAAVFVSLGLVTAFIGVMIGQ